MPPAAAQDSEKRAARRPPRRAGRGVAAHQTGVVIVRVVLRWARGRAMAVSFPPVRRRPKGHTSGRPGWRAFYSSCDRPPPGPVGQHRDQDRPLGSHDEERPEGNVGPQRDPARRRGGLPARRRRPGRPPRPPRPTAKAGQEAHRDEQLQVADPDRAGPEGDGHGEQEDGDGQRREDGRRQGPGRDERVRPRRSITRTRGIAGRVTTSGRSRWSRSVARRSVSAAKKVPEDREGDGVREAEGQGPHRRAAQEDDDGRPPVDRADPALRPDDRPVLVQLGLVGRPAGPDAVGRQPPRGPRDSEAGGEDGRLHALAGPGERQLHERRRGRARGAAGRPGSRLAEAGRPRDVEVDPGHRHELAQEEGAADQAAVGR